MHRLITGLLIIYLSMVQAQETEHVEETITMSPLAAASPETAAALEALTILKTESSTTISDRHDQVGFKTLEHIVDYSRGSIYEAKLDTLIDLWLSDDILSSIEPRHKAIVISKLKEYALQIKDENFHTQRFDLKFNNGAGKLFLLVLSFQPHPTKPNAIKWDKVLMTAFFEPAPPYVIITESDCNIISCDRTDRIEYLPAMLTDAHTQSILQLSMNLLSTHQASNMIAY
jgi:hypothetical protein